MDATNYHWIPRMEEPQPRTEADERRGALLSVVITFLWIGLLATIAAPPATDMLNDTTASLPSP